MALSSLVIIVREGARSMEHIIIGVDLAKPIFPAHVPSGSAELIFCKRLTRYQFWDFMSHQPPSSVVFEACGGSS